MVAHLSCNRYLLSVKCPLRWRGIYYGDVATTHALHYCYYYYYYYKLCPNSLLKSVG